MWLGNHVNVIPILNDLLRQFMSNRFEIRTQEPDQDWAHCSKHIHKLCDKIRIPSRAAVSVRLAGVGFTRFAAPPPLFMRQLGVISMRINVVINHSVPPLPDVIQGLLKTSLLCDVYGRREIWAWQPCSPKTLVQSPCGTLFQSVSYYCAGSSQTQANFLPPERGTIKSRPDRQLFCIYDWWCL